MLRGWILDMMLVFGVVVVSCDGGTQSVISNHAGWEKRGGRRNLCDNSGQYYSRRHLVAVRPSAVVVVIPNLPAAYNYKQPTTSTFWPNGARLARARAPALAHA